MLKLMMRPKEKYRNASLEFLLMLMLIICPKKKPKKEGEDKCLGIFLILYIFAAIVGIVDICLNGLWE
jgi:hypothetical protein